MDSLVYLVHEAEGAVLLLRSIPLNGAGNDFTERLQELLTQQEELSLLYRRIRLALPQTRAVLVPRRLFKPAELHTYVSSLVEVSEKDGLYADELPGADINVCYKVPLDLADHLRKQFPTARMFAQATPFIKGALQLAHPSQVGSLVCAGFAGQDMQLCLLRQGQLLFYNTFPYQAAQDVLYYIMLLYDRFQLDTAEVPLYLTGAISADSDIYSKLYSYVGTLTFAGLPAHLSLGKKFSDLPPHLFFNLFALCQL